ARRSRSRPGAGAGQSCRPEAEVASIGRARPLLRSGRRFELVDPAVRFQRQKEMAVSDDVRADVLPLLDDVVVERVGWTHGSGQREWTEFEACPVRLPCASAAIAVDASR